MKRIAIALVLGGLILLADNCLAGVTLSFDSKEPSEVCIKFTNEFKKYFDPRIKYYPFIGDYAISLFESEALVRYQDEKGDRYEKELAVGVLINGDRTSIPWILIKDSDSEEEIKQRAKEFSNKIVERLKLLEREKSIKPKI